MTVLLHCDFQITQVILALGYFQDAVQQVLLLNCQNCDNQRVNKYHQRVITVIMFSTK